MSESKILKVVFSLLIIVFLVQIVIASLPYPTESECMDTCYEYCGSDCRGLNGTCTGSNGNPGYRFECWSGGAHCCYYGIIPE